LEANPDKLVVLKVFAPWCRACKGLEPKFNAIVKDSKYESLPIVWADLTIQHNKAYVKSLGVLALPSIQFYSHGGIAENFPCGPSKVPILKRKLVQFINANVDAKTLTVRDQPAETISEYILEPYRNDTDVDDDLALAPPADTDTATVATMQMAPATDAATTVVVDDKTKDAIITPKLLSKLRAISYLSTLTESQFEGLMTKAKQLTFEAGSIIMREGGVGRRFYFITQGEVEVCQKTSFEDPLTTPSTYLGTVINRLDKGDYFGERSLITGEPRAASIRASSDLAVKALAFDVDDFPATCVLSGKAEASVLMAQRADVDEKYGVYLSDTTMMNKQLDDIYMANQVRGSINTPSVIDGVDNDLEVKEVDVKAPKPRPQVAMDEGSGWRLAADPRSLVPLLVRFKLLRSVNRCFEYIMSNRPVFGEVGALRRRRMLVELLPPSQKSEFKDAFDLIDIDGDGQVTLMELRRSLDAVGEQKSDQELLQLIQRSNGGVGGSGFYGGSIFSAKQVITEQDFMGLMAEAEFFNLFIDTFRALDTQDSGFVRAKDLDRVLCGVRDLISDDRKSIIDVEDKDILIDYEQFSKMLLGRALL
jgi:calmodulin